MLVPVSPAGDRRGTVLQPPALTREAQAALISAEPGDVGGCQME